MKDRSYPRFARTSRKLSGPKELLILDGSAHAQFLFATDQRDRLLREILHFLAQPLSRARSLEELHSAVLLMA
jgi:hypothetical protein